MQTSPANLTTFLMTRLKQLLSLSSKLFIYFLIGLFVNCSDSQIRFPIDQLNQKNIVESPSKPENSRITRVTFVAVGDIMLSRGVDHAIECEGNLLLPFSQLSELLSSTDFNFGNLESPVSGNDKIIGRGLIFNAHQHDLAGLVKYNFKIVNLANNHALDQGLKGLRFTQKYLEKMNISYLGVGENKIQAWQPKIIDINGIKIGFVGASYTSINDGGSIRNSYVARTDEFEYLKVSIEKLKNTADFIVVTMHSGVEYKRNPNRAQIDFARTAIDSGADLVIGSHPHWIQTFEKYQGKYIFYSLGNFIFDQRWQETKEGLVLCVSVLKTYDENSQKISTRLERIELIPIIIERVGMPRRATGKEKNSILKKIGTFNLSHEPEIFYANN